MHKLFVAVMIDSEHGDLVATAELEIEVPFVPSDGMRIDYAGPEDEPTIVELKEVVWQATRHRFEMHLDIRGENDGTAVAIIDEYTDVGFKLTYCSDARFWENYRNDPAEGNGAAG